MKRLILIFILTLSFLTFAKADDVRDFEIEGMSLGDSALKFYSKKKILDNIQYGYYNDDLYHQSEFDSNSNKYDHISIMFLSEDKNYIIKGITAIKFMDSKKCLKERYVIKKQMDEVWPNTSSEEYSKVHPADKTGNSKYHHILYRMYNNEKVIANAVVECLDWTKELKKSKGWTDNLNLRIALEDLEEWVRTKAFN